ncbi:MAG: GNAT family N-acetyltransferase [Lachnospiraceae bacterium]|nr:GNAT family N-acetyltransferase [Lachnospiraceae bacterium]
MNKQDIDRIVRSQFRLDTNCSLEDEKEKIININETLRLDGSRYFDDLDPFFRAIIYHGEMYMSADKRILSWCRENYSLYKPEWFCKFENLRTLDKKLNEYGYKIKDTHVYCLPDPDFEGYDFDVPYDIRVLDDNEILKIRDGNPFTHALMYIPDCPDVIAVEALDKEGRAVAMAGASKDAELMWQIGIDVLSGYEHKGLAVYLVTKLKEILIDKGIVPFYGTSESHSNSMDVAIRSGFMPSFTEVFCTGIT